MRKIDLHWQSKDEWWEFENGIPVVRKDAPDEAQESYRRFLEQIEKEIED